MPLDKSMFETNTSAPMGLGDFEARQRAMKQEDRRRKTVCAESMRQTQFGGLSQSDMTLSDIKKEARKSQADATKFMHENLSRESQGCDAQFLKDKAHKEEDRKKKLDAVEQRRSYKGGVNENDLKLAEIKKEERMQKQAVDELNRACKSGGVRDDDLRLAEIKKEDRLKKQAADEHNRGYKGGVKEEDLKLAEIKREARQKEQDAKHFNHENLSKDSQAVDAQFLKDKAVKEESKQGKLAADELRRGYKGGVREDDLKLAEIKKEERQQKQAADEINRGYSGGVKDDDLKLAEIKKEERMKKQAAADNNRGYKGGVNENDLKLSEIKKEGRQMKKAADENNHSYGGVKNPGSPTAVTETVEISQPVEEISQPDEAN